MHSRDLGAGASGNAVFCLFAKTSTKTLGLQNLTGQMAQIYKLQDGKRVAVETINPKETKPIEDDDQVKFDVLTLWIEKIEVTKL